ncbi:MAG: class I SAM-dependent methyltransferase [Acidobacteria bacterium]|nr:class I SAM-dependent methyltransferase [Acidobacteriota bacterium]
MERLTKKDYWNTVYLGTAPFQAKARATGQSGRSLKGWLKRTLGEYWRDYSDYLEWDVLYPTYLPNVSGLKIIEIGSAPGTNLVRHHKTFGYEPYGVEYAEAGANLNREEFSQHGLNPNNVIRADAFSEEFLTRYEGYFDLVLSRGFIEHFTEMDKVMNAHLRLLKPGGTLIVTIPKLTGAPNLLFRLFNPEVIPMHNLKIMNRRSFASLFRRKELKQQYCNDYGTFKVSVCGATQLSGVKATVMNALMNVQLLLNMFFRAAFGKQGAESHWFSPYLIYIGTKEPSPHSKEECPKRNERHCHSVN